VELIFWDPVAPKPYALSDVGRRAVPGTEATVIRIAERLDALVVQDSRSIDEGRYVGPSEGLSARTMVVLRDPAFAVRLARQHPGSRVVLWLHDYPDRDYARRLQAQRQAMAECRIDLVCVSDSHRRAVVARLGSIGPLPAISFIYNPVEVPDEPRGPVDPDKLIFLSSPKKGLAYTLTVFGWMRKRWPSLRLHVANPGYHADEAAPGNGVVLLGAISRPEVLRHTAESLCVFYPSYKFPETFGLVFAESNAVGTPVLAHPIGAALEVLGDTGQVVPVPRSRFFVDKTSRLVPGSRPILEALAWRAGGFSAYERKLEEWRGGGRPRVSLRPEFRLDAVVKAWRSLLQV
jgi:glycosyltransferase involved in cell wall biosynthesis